jgi:hypothetical protein
VIEMGDYFAWINSLADLLVQEIEKELGKGFVRDGRMAWEAAKHSEAMMRIADCYHAPAEYWGAASSELVGEDWAPYNQWSIEQAVKRLSHDFLASPEHCNDLKHFPAIGAGISIMMISFSPYGREIHRVRIFAAIRLRK